MTALWLAHRTSALWLAALAHRLSGLALAAFLPLHFLTLGLAISGEAKLEGFLRWSDQPIVKLSEAILVFLLAIHMLGTAATPSSAISWTRSRAASGCRTRISPGPW